MLPPLTMLKLALTNLRVNKLRSALTVLGIVFGTGAVIATLSSNEGAASYVRDEIKKLGTNVINVQQRGRGATFEVRDCELVERYVPALKSATLALDLGMLQARQGVRSASVSVLGVEPEYFETNALAFARGRRLGRSEVRGRDMVLVLGAKAATSIFGDGNPIARDVVLYVESQPLVFRVVGVLKEKGSTAARLDGSVFLPHTVARKIAKPGAFQASILARVRRDEDSAEVKGAMMALLGSRFKDGVVISDAREAIESTRKIWESQNLVGIVLAAISLVTGGVGIMNIMLLSIAQRRREIGIRKSIGAKTRQVFSQFLLESILLCLLGGAVGILVGVAFGQQVASLMGQWEARVSPQIVVLALASACVTGIVFGIAPALRAARLDPFEALRG